MLARETDLSNPSDITIGHFEGTFRTAQSASFSSDEHSIRIWSCPQTRYIFFGESHQLGQNYQWRGFRAVLAYITF